MNLLLEDGSPLLLEDGGELLLEDTPIEPAPAPELAFVGGIYFWRPDPVVEKKRVEEIRIRGDLVAAPATIEGYLRVDPPATAAPADGAAARVAIPVPAPTVTRSGTVPHVAKAKRTETEAERWARKRLRTYEVALLLEFIEKPVYRVLIEDVQLEAKGIHVHFRRVRGRTDLERRVNRRCDCYRLLWALRWIDDFALLYLDSEARRELRTAGPAGKPARDGNSRGLRSLVTAAKRLFTASPAGKPPRVPG